MNQNSKAPTKKHSRRNKQSQTLAVTLASIALILAGLSFLTSLASKSSLQDEKDSLAQKSLSFTAEQDASISSIKTKQEALQTQLAKQIKEEQKQNAKLNKLNQVLIQSLSSSQNKSEQWKLLEGEHTLKLAELSLRWSYDLPTSIVLLENLDETLANLNRLDLHTIRTTLHATIADLKAIPPLGEVKILSQLQALIKQSDELKFIETDFKTPKAKKATPSNISQDDHPMRKAFDKTLESLKEVVIIRHNTKPYQPKLSPEDINLITRDLILSLEQAKWAVVQRNASLYEYSLKQVQTLIADNYQPSNKTKSMQNALSQLEKIELNPHLPDLQPLFHQLKALSQPKEKGNRA